jgi:prolipoprotein diacylglyceryltransferase
MPTLAAAPATPLRPAVIELAFDPALELGGLVVRWQALALAAVIAVALLLFARDVRRRVGPVRSDDLAFVVLAAIPGAVVGGRLVHGLVFHDAYALDPAALLDLGRGSLSLVGAVVGGALTAGYVCRQLGGRPGAWADAAAIPLLLAIGGGKLAMLLGGAGQGLPWDGRGAVAFLGEGPWGSPEPAIAAYPTQLLEGVWALLGIPVLLVAERWIGSGERSGRGLLLLAAAAWWLAGRAAVAVWWRDETVLGPWGREGLVALVGLGLVVLIGAIVARRSSTSDQGPYRGALPTS